MLNNNNLWYNQPAKIWEEALPIGNGRLGGMVFGGIENETIHLNEDTLWSGYPKDKNNQQAFKYLKKSRDLVFNKQYYKAQCEIKKHMLCDFNESYEPLAKLNIDLISKPQQVTNYKRELDLKTAISKTTYNCDDVTYERVYFSSNPDNVIVCKYLSNCKGKINLSVSLESLLKYEINIKDTSTIVLSGQCPSHTDPNYLNTDNPIIYDEKENNRAMTFETRLNITKTSGTAYIEDNKIVIKDADTVTFFIVANTSYNGFNKNPGKDGKNPSLLCDNDLLKIKDKSFEDIKKDHISDFGSLFDRVSLNLPSSESSKLPTNERLKAFSKGSSDFELVSLLFNFGRYLMISSSRQNTQPANLQGIWNSELRPPWSSNLTTNINAQMNYWPVETCNLSECHNPLFDMMKELIENGKKTAKIHYECRGWVSHHNVDIWRQSSPVGEKEAGNYSPTYAFWPMSSGWLCRHLWEHYCFTLDIDFLKDKAYPIMKEAALFYCDWLINDKNGELTTCPSTSPENSFITKTGRTCAVSKGSTMDLSIITDLFNNCISACSKLNIDSDFSSELKSKLERIKPFRIGKYGQLQEWCEDFKEAEVHHRHISHLYGLYPASLITPKNTPELSKAAINTLNRRGDAGTGWSLSWKVNLWARLNDGNRALSLIKQQLNPVLKTEFDYKNGGGTYPNMFGAHPPFQIDCNFGITAGIAEMLLQSHDDTITILPALPDKWDKGSVSGLKARNGFEVDISWDKGLPTKVCIKSQCDNILNLKYKDKCIKMNVQKNGLYNFNQQSLID